MLLDLETLTSQSFQFEIVLDSFLLSPLGDLLLARSQDLKVGMLIDLGSGEVIHGPSEDLFYARQWSPDGRLLAMRRDDEIFFFDVTSGVNSPVAPELKGERVFLGWVPDPSIYPQTPGSSP